MSQLQNPISAQIRAFAARTGSRGGRGPQKCIVFGVALSMARRICQFASSASRRQNHRNGGQAFRLPECELQLAICARKRVSQLALLIFCCLVSVLRGGVEQSNYFVAIKKNDGTSLETYFPFVAPEGKYYADPFLFKFEGVNYLFFEDYDYKKGVISYAVLDQNGIPSQPQLALALPVHLSFPCIFQDQGEIYMIPETYRYESISIYRCRQFPNEWKRERVLVRGHRFADPILFKYNGYYWLFTAIHRDLLCIYYAKDLKSPFLPHPINGLHIKGRNAGSVFSVDGRLIRPTMDCSERYGRAMILKEIVLLTTTEFVEKELAYIEPDWAPNLDGTHTYSQNEDFIVYDGERLR